MAFGFVKQLTLLLNKADIIQQKGYSSVIEFGLVFYIVFRRPTIRDNKNRTIKMKKRIFAMPAALAAIPAKPKIPAIIATTSKIMVQRNIVIVLREMNVVDELSNSQIMPGSTCPFPQSLCSPGAAVCVETSRQ